MVNVLTVISKVARLSRNCYGNVDGTNYSVRAVSSSPRTRIPNSESPCGLENMIEALFSGSVCTHVAKSCRPSFAPARR
jgi:hypothetical protein